MERMIRAEEAARPSNLPVRLTTNDALLFLLSVKREFDDSSKYQELLDIMRNQCRRGSLDIDAVVSRVKVLFDGHPHLIAGFNAFLPEGKKIEI
ncbi:hypothetical protein EJB05_49752 [Eragrostis curvula]|uniref:Histone deacetylase interacting domain-containing protein n=1 Tax=Eragrostis curvula TaxID=38414 RepID=A0A5J9T7K4_9POAL|nr:hypothetical protein EJB05_49752 [Eragrostis curvula]